MRKVIINGDNIALQYTDTMFDAVNIIQTEQEGYLIGMQWNGSEFIPYISPTTVVELTPEDFRKRFTFPELASIYTLAKTDVIIELFLDELKIVKYVDTKDPRTIYAVEYVHQLGLITEERRNEILA